MNRCADCSHLYRRNGRWACDRSFSRRVAPTDQVGNCLYFDLEPDPHPLAVAACHVADQEEPDEA